MSNDLPRFASQIEEAYRHLGHTLGWRFLYSPASTLKGSTQLVFAGLNPGGGRFESPIVSVEAGNAYRVEPWGPNGTLNSLQVQIGRLYAALAEQLDVAANALMDETLAVNFCPFRSPSWDALARPDDSIRFSTDLWQQMLATARPRVVICLGELATRHIAGVIVMRGGAPLDPPAQHPIGWGKVTFASMSYATADGQVLVIRLPHLSRFGFFGRPQSASAVQELVRTASSALLR